MKISKVMITNPKTEMIALIDPMHNGPELQTFRIGSVPIIRQLIDKMEHIDKISPVKKEDCQLSVGTRIAILIINQLTDHKALYKVEKFYGKQDMA